MARFKAELPTDIMRDIQRISDNTDEILGEMTKAGAEVVMQNVKANAPSNIANHVRLTRTYKTPSDGGINTKVYVSGYIPFSDPNRKVFTRKGGSGKSYTTTEGVPADFLANLYEYGRSTAPFPKHPFFRKSFKKAEIKAAMLKAQERASGGILK